MAPAARTAAAMLILAVVSATACAHRPQPSSWRFGLPVYPSAVLERATSGAASFAVFRTLDPQQTVDDWYADELPAGTPHAASPAKHESTFALFDARGRRTVHLAAQGNSTEIVLTSLQR